MSSLKGTLGSVDLANVFQVLSLNQRQGTLWIFDGASRKAIWFGPDGASMLTRGRNQPDTVGRILVRNDKLTPERLDEALRIQAERPDAPLGQLLVEYGMASREDVESAMRTQIEEEIYSLFIWKDAQFEFVEGPPDEALRGDDVARLTFNVNGLIMEAAKRVDEWEWIHRIVPSTDVILRYTGTNVALDDEVFAQPYAEKVLAAVDGRRSVDEIIAETCVHRFEVAKMIAILREGKAVAPIPVPELRRHALAALAVEDTVQAEKFLRRLVERKGDTPEMHRQVAEIFERRRELERAAAHYRAHAEILWAGGDRNRAYETYRHIHRLVPTDLDAADRAIAIYVAGAAGLEGETSAICALGKSLAEIHLELGRRGRAIEVLQRVAGLDPEDLEVRHRLIHVYLLQGMRGEAIAEYDALGEAAIARRDWEEAERIFRKILQIDRTRDDAQSRLNQIVSRKRLRRRGIKIAVATVLLASAAGFAGHRGWRWYEERRHIRIAEAAEFGAKLSDLRIRQQPLRDDLDAAAKALAAPGSDLTAVVAALKADDATRPPLVARANEAVREFHALAQGFPEVEDASQAADAAKVVEQRVAFLESQAEGLRRQVTDEIENLFDRVEPWPPALTLAELDTILTRLTALAEAAPEWRASERGVRAAGYARNVSDTLRAFESMRKDVAANLASGDVASAQTRLVEFLSRDLPPKDLLEQIQAPRTVTSRPAGARILVNGADSGLVTPAVVPTGILTPTVLRLEKEGFETAVVAIPALERILPRSLREDLRLEVDEPLQKALAFRTPALKGRLAGAPASAGDAFVVATVGDEAAVFDFAGSLRMKLPTAGLTGVRVRPVVARDLVVFASQDGMIVPTSLAGDRYARERLGAGVVADPAVSGDLAIFADGAGRLTAYDTLRLRRGWRHPAGGGGRKSGYQVAPTIHDGELYAVAADGSVVVVDARTGAEIRASRGPVTAEGAVLGTSLTGSGPYVLGVTRPARGRSRVLLIDRGTLEVRSSFPLDGEAVWAPLVTENAVHVVTRDGEVWTLLVEGGALSAARSLRLYAGSAKLGEPALQAGVLYVGDTDGRLFAVDVGREAPALRYEFRIPPVDRNPVAVTTRPAFAGEHVLFGAADNAVYAVRR